MTQVMTTTAVAIFPDRATAEHAVRALQDAGFPPDRIGMALHEHTATDDRVVTEEPLENAGDGAGIGALAGASIGGLAGGTLLGLLGGGLAGGLIGALIGLGIPEKEAHDYQREMDAGRVVVSVQANGRFAEAMDILREFGGREAQARPPEANPGVLP